MAKKLTPKQKEYREKLRKAIKLVKSTHWIKGAYKVRKGELYYSSFKPMGTPRGKIKRAEKDLYCTIGLVRVASGLTPHDGSGNLERVVRQVFKNNSRRKASAVETWNDKESRTREDVVDFLREVHDEIPNVV